MDSRTPGLADQHRLEQENRALRQMLRDLGSDAAHNQAVMQRFQDREMALLNAPDLPNLLDCLTLGMQHSFGLDSVRLLLLDPEHVVRELLCAGGTQPESLSDLHLLHDCLTVHTLYPDLYHPWLGPWNEYPHAEMFRCRSLTSVALLPLRQTDGLAGFLNLGSRDAQRFVPGQATDFLHRLSCVAAVCLENAVNRERLRIAGLTDGLTGLYNRRHLEQRMVEEVARARRHHHALSVLFIDADHFKRINDTYGHAAGDQALVAIAARVREQLRASDLAARYGGEELSVVLPQTDLANALPLAERIRERVAQDPVRLNDGRSLHVQVSIGVAELNPTQLLQRADPDLARDLLASADAAAYSAKAHGRNCVAVETPSR